MIILAKVPTENRRKSKQNGIVQQLQKFSKEFIIERFTEVSLWVHFGRAFRLVSTKILHPRRFQTTTGRISKQS